MSLSELHKAERASGRSPPLKFTLYVTEENATVALTGCVWVKLISGVFYCPELGKHYKVTPGPLPFDPKYRRIEAAFE